MDEARVIAAAKAVAAHSYETGLLVNDRDRRDPKSKLLEFELLSAILGRPETVEAQPLGAS